MSISGVGLVQTLQPARPANQPQPVAMPPDDRDTAAQAARGRDTENTAQTQGRTSRAPPPEPGKGTLVDRTA